VCDGNTDSDFVYASCRLNSLSGNFLHEEIMRLPVLVWKGEVGARWNISCKDPGHRMKRCSKGERCSDHMIR